MRQTEHLWQQQQQQHQTCRFKNDNSAGISNRTLHFTFSVLSLTSAVQRCQRYTQRSPVCSIDRQAIILFAKECGFNYTLGRNFLLA
jgi:hypothetical protein